MAKVSWPMVVFILVPVYSVLPFSSKGICSSLMAQAAPVESKELKFIPIVRGKTFHYGLRSVTPAWDLDKDGFCDFLAIFCTNVKGEKRKGGGVERFGFISGKSGDEITLPEGFLKASLHGLDPLAIDSFPRQSFKEPVGILLLGRSGKKGDTLTLILLGKSLLKKRTWKPPFPLNRPGLKGIYEGVYGWKSPRSFPQGVVLASLKGGERFVFYSLGKGAIEATISEKGTRVIRPGRWAVNLGPLREGGSEGVGLFFFREGGEKDESDLLIFKLLEYPSFKMNFKKVIPTYSGEDSWYWPHSACLVDDLDGDFVRDVCLGYPIISGGKKNSEIGKVSVFSGKEGRAIYSILGEKGFDEFGSSLAKLEDLDGDGISEIAVGAPEYFYELSGMGRGFVKIFSGKTGNVLRRLGGKRKGDHFGVRLACSGDLLFVGCGRPSYVFGIQKFWIFFIKNGKNKVRLNGR